MGGIQETETFSKDHHKKKEIIKLTGKKLNSWIRQQTKLDDFLNKDTKK